MKKKILISVALLLSALPGLAQFKNSSLQNLPYSTGLKSNHVFVIGEPGSTNKNLTYGTVRDQLSAEGKNFAPDPELSLLSSWDVVDCILTNGGGETLVYEGNLMTLPKGVMLLYGVWYNGISSTTNWGTINAAVGRSLATGLTKIGPILEPEDSWEAFGVSPGRLYYENGTNYLTYFGTPEAGFEKGETAIGIAYTTDGTNWTKYANNPVLEVSESGWDSVKLYVSSIFKHEGVYYLFYNAYNGSLEQIGFATGPTMFGPWTKHSGNPVIPDPFIAADPNVFRLKSGGFGMTYRTISQFGSVPSVPGTSWSRDLTNWFAHGVTEAPGHTNSITYRSFHPSLNPASAQLYGGGMFEDGGPAMLMDDLSKIFVLRPTKSYSVVTNLISAYAQPLDVDLTDLADGSLTGSKVGTGINGDNVTSGTVAAARLPSNSSSSAGIVATGSGQANKVWKTDGSGNPDWRDDESGGEAADFSLTLPFWTNAASETVQYTNAAGWIINISGDNSIANQTGTVSLQNSGGMSTLIGVYLTANSLCFIDSEGNAVFKSITLLSGGAISVDSVNVDSFNFSTNSADGTDLVDFSGPSIVTTNLSNNLTFGGVTGFDATGGTNYYAKVYFVRATGANRTIAAPTEWVTTRANHVATNGVLAKFMVEMQVGIFTNMSQVDFPN